MALVAVVPVWPVFFEFTEPAPAPGIWAAGTVVFEETGRAVVAVVGRGVGLGAVVGVGMGFGAVLGVGMGLGRGAAVAGT